ncbi:FUSC family protein [Serratia sp. 3ACOL1]|uniref:FUSC family protein n=1 Tax=Serratia sp. 3ACOL1 TaxID=2448483 RepID=UPI00267CC620
MNSPTFLRLRFACKLSFAIVFALFVGFHLNLETPRWSVLTAAIVAAGPAFAAGGNLSQARSAIVAGCVLSAPLSAVLSVY